MLYMKNFKTVNPKSFHQKKNSNWNSGLYTSKFQMKLLRFPALKFPQNCFLSVLRNLNSSYVDIPFACRQFKKILSLYVII